jgi:hypothetical protein
MAVHTLYGRLVEIFLMFHETEIGQAIVFKVSQRQERNVCISTFMFRVAIFAAGRIVQSAV